MRRFKHFLVLSSLAVLAAACGAGVAGNGPGGTQRSSLRGPITFEEIQAAHGSTALEIIRALRPTWLRPQGADPSTVAVYLNGSRFGTIASLGTVSAVDLQSVEFIEPRNAQLRFGIGHEAGAIVLTSRR